MVVPIGRIDPKTLAQILGGDEIMAAVPTPSSSVPSAGDMLVKKTSSPFDDILSKAVDSLEQVSKAENNTNALINEYVRGNVDISDVMIATSKMNLMMQLAVTAVTSAVNTFKEITQIQV